MIDADTLREDILSVPVWGFQLPNAESFNNELIDFAFWLEANTEGKNRSNFLGWQSNDYLYVDYSNFLTPLISSVTETANSIVKDFSERINTSVKINSMWLNINKQHSHNAHHIHSGTLSGVYWIRVPEDSGRLVLVNPAGRSDAHRIRIKNYGLTPTPGACIIFPSWLEHYVEPNKNSQERISISFNID